MMPLFVAISVSVVTGIVSGISAPNDIIHPAQPLLFVRILAPFIVWCGAGYLGYCQDLLTIGQFLSLGLMTGLFWGGLLLLNRWLRVYPRLVFILGIVTALIARMQDGFGPRDPLFSELTLLLLGAGIGLAGGYHLGCRINRSEL